MPRPKRLRRVCTMLGELAFTSNNTQTETVELTYDEYEVIRIVDYEMKSHDECAKIMDISRTTVTEIYDIARMKIADSIANGKNLRIIGGTVRFCNGEAFYLCGRKCPRLAAFNKEKYVKGGQNLRIAVTYENGNVFQHFGHTEAFKIYDCNNGSVTASAIIGTNGQGHGALASFLSANNVEVLICGGIGVGAINALASFNIKIYQGCKGLADDRVNEFLNDRLIYDKDAVCSHHEHADHDCGDHDSCANNSKIKLSRDI